MNLNLSISSVGFYQVTKLAIIPALLLANLLLKGHWPVSKKMMASLCVLSFGLALATVHDVTLSPSSFGAGIMAVVSTCLFQIGIQQARQAHGLSSLQLQYQVALPQALLTLSIAIPSECIPPDDLLLALKAQPVAIQVWVATSVLLAMGAGYYAFAVVG